MVVYASKQDALGHNAHIYAQLPSSEKEKAKEQRKSQAQNTHKIYKTHDTIYCNGAMRRMERRLGVPNVMMNFTSTRPDTPKLRAGGQGWW